MYTMEDETLTCRDCGKTFVFTASEQQFFAEKGFTNKPGRCPECRRAKRARTGDNRPTYPAVCEKCGKSFELRFEPREGRPVYCDDCYREMRPPRY